jgi:hypothetical protein
VVVVVVVVKGPSQLLSLVGWLAGWLSMVLFSCGNDRWLHIAAWEGEGKGALRLHVG